MSKRKVSSDVYVFDIETTQLAANRGHMLCAAGKWIGDKHIDQWDIESNNKLGWGTSFESWEYDLDIAEGLKEKLESAKAVIAYFGGYNKFDVPFVNTRLLRWGAKPLKQLSIIDPYIVAKSKLKLARNTMDSVGTLLGCKHKKGHVPWVDWHRAQFGDLKALERLKKYNVGDILVLEEIYLKLLPMFPNHPLTASNVSTSTDACRVCGGATYSKGWRYLSKTRVHDIVCKSCGWRGDGRRERL